MDSSRKRKYKKAPLMEERSGEVTPKRRGGEEKEDPAEGCSRQVKETTTPEKEVSKKPSFIMRLQRRWSRIASFLKNTKKNIVQKGGRLWTDNRDVQPEQNRKRKASGKTSSDAGERSAQDRSRKRTRSKPQRPSDSSGSSKKTSEGHAASQNRYKKERKTSPKKCPKEEKTEKRKRHETNLSSGVIKDEEQAGPSKILRAEPKAHVTASEETMEKVAQFHLSTAPLTLDTFTFHHVLGEGGYGRVLLATDSIRREHVAIKIIKKRLLRDYRAGLVEGRILRMTHGSRFLVHGYGAFHTKQHAYYVMELVSGGTLQQLMKKNLWLDLPTLRFIAAEMVCGLQFLHCQGVIHRDLKTNNVLLTTDGHIKITDFGLCLDNVYGITKATDFIGTPGFAAPEMIRAEPYCAAVDWFAFGVMMHILVIGVHPFHANTVEEVNKLVLEHEPDYQGIDSAAADFLTGLLCKNQSHRLGAHGDIRKHPFFSTIQWGDLEAGKVPSPIQLGKDPTDALVTNQIPVLRSEEGKEPENEQELFKDFPFVCPVWADNYHKAPMH